MMRPLLVFLNDYRQIVLSKSFLLALILPVMAYGGMFLAGYWMRDKTDLRERNFVVVDESGGGLYEVLKSAADDRNRSDQVMDGSRQVQPFFLPEQRDFGDLSGSEILLQLSDEVRRGELFAFAWIEPNVLSADARGNDAVRYYSDSPTYMRLPEWIERRLREAVEEIRFAEAGLNLREVRRLSRFGGLNRFRLVDRAPDGTIAPPRRDNPVASILIPMGIVLLVFVSIQMSTPVLLNSVIEEKMQRIAEVLLSSISSFQLLTGKLMAGTAVGFTFSLVYLISMALSLSMFQMADLVPAMVYVWYFPFLFTGLLTFGSMFAAMSAACQDLKDSQNFIGVLMMVMVVPLILAIVMVESPAAPLARGLSMTPVFGIMLMVMRIAIPPGPPAWEIWIALGGNLLFAWFMVWAAARVFRIGILSQGKAPKLRELWRWLWVRG